METNEKRRLRILVVDDSRAMRAYLRSSLKGFDAEVSECGSGTEGLRMLARLGSVDLCILDWNLPEMDGLAMLVEIRKSPAHDAMRIVMVTTEVEADRVRQALEAGAQEYLMKPFTPEALLEKLSLIGLAKP